MFSEKMIHKEFEDDVSMAFEADEEGERMASRCMT
jgi:hypothetical protein